MRPTTFELTENHIKLIRQMHVNWQNCETGAPEVDPKRPYGNSYVAGDVADALGVEPDINDDPSSPQGDWRFSEKIEEEMLAIHRETEIALQVVLAAGSFEPGTYVRPNPYVRDWRKVPKEGR